jgi:hypothetical protein
VEVTESGDNPPLPNFEYGELHESKHTPPSYFFSIAAFLNIPAAETSRYV